MGGNNNTYRDINNENICGYEYGMMAYLKMSSDSRL